MWDLLSLFYGKNDLPLVENNETLIIMKRIITALAVLAVLFSAFSCGTKAKVAPGRTEIQEVFSSPEYRSDRDFIRAVGTAISPNESMAKKQARLDAREQIAQGVNTVIKMLTQNYQNQYGLGTDTDFASKFQSMSNEVVNATLNGAVEKDSKLFMLGDGRYQSYICVEYPKAAMEEALKGAAQSISKEAKYNIDFQEYQFKKAFDAAMAEYAESQK